MNAQATMTQLEKLKLAGMAAVYKAVQNLPLHQRPDLDQFMAQLTEAEQLDRQNKRTIMRSHKSDQVLPVHSQTGNNTLGSLKSSTT